jgi:fructose/tagatose bisphosphate aldolase
MPIIRNGEKAREIIDKVNIITTEAIFIGAKKFKEAQNIKGQLPLIIAFTASYEQRQQLKNYSGLSDFKEGLLAVRDDIERIARDEGKFNNIDVIVHLDHAQPGDDDWIFKENKDFISSIMYDCSCYSLNDNIKMVKDFVKKHKKDFVIEGCVDEIYNYVASNEKLEVKDIITEVDDVESYFKETGVDLVVANLGTEHRRTESVLKRYWRDVAQKIRDKIGRQLVIHGTSSLSCTEFKNLPQDGIVKANIWTILEVNPSRIMAGKIIKNIDKMLLKESIEKLVKKGFLNKKVLNKGGKPSLDFLTEKYRRDDILIPDIVKQVKNYYENFYINY